jgi:hypothetical protein
MPLLLDEKPPLILWCFDGVPATTRVVMWYSKEKGVLEMAGFEDTTGGTTFPPPATIDAFISIRRLFSELVWV